MNRTMLLSRIGLAVLLGMIGFDVAKYHEALLRYLCMPMLYEQSGSQIADEMRIAAMSWYSPVLTYGLLYGESSPELYAENDLSAVQKDNDRYEHAFTDYGYQKEHEKEEIGISADTEEGNVLTEADAIAQTSAIPTSTEAAATTAIVDDIVTSDMQFPYTRQQLQDFNFLMGHCYTVDSTTYVDANEMNADTLLSMDMHIQQDASDYQILIYHTHSASEGFVDSRPGVLEDTTIGLGDTLTALLEGYGYKVYHDRTVYDMINGKIDRNYAYTAAGEGIDRILAEHPGIEVVIDLHRDGLNPNTHLVTEINGKPTAKIMFFNGVSRTVRNGELDYLYNPNRQANLAFSLQLYLTGKAMYDDYLRNIYIKGYQYNLDRRPKAALIEVGGQTNTLEEVNNAMEPLAVILHQVLSGGHAWE